VVVGSKLNSAEGAVHMVTVLKDTLNFVCDFNGYWLLNGNNFRIQWDGCSCADFVQDCENW
jgi:hypothetical protein